MKDYSIMSFRSLVDSAKARMQEPCTYQEEESLAERADRICKESDRKRDMDHWIECNIPIRYREASLDNISPQLKVALQDCSNAILEGSNGAGKTYTAYALAIDYKTNHRDEDVIVIDAVSMLKDIRNNNFDTLKYEYAALLIIDEADKINGSNNDFVLLSDIINNRYSWARKTILILNKNEGKTASEVVGQSIFSRLTGEAEGGRYIKASGKNRREAV